jgi:hypothetical protein
MTSLLSCVSCRNTQQPCAAMHCLDCNCRYLQQQHAAIVIATAGSLPPSHRPPHTPAPHKNHVATSAPAPQISHNEVNTPNMYTVQASSQLLGVLGRGGIGGSRDTRPVWLASLDHTVLATTSVHVIAEDLAAVLDILQDSPQHFAKWLQRQQQQQYKQQGGATSSEALPDEKQQLFGHTADAASQAQQLPTSAAAAPAGPASGSMPKAGSSNSSAAVHVLGSSNSEQRQTCDIQHSPTPSTAAQRLTSQPSSTTLDITMLQAQHQQGQQQQRGSPNTVNILPTGRTTSSLSSGSTASTEPDKDGHPVAAAVSGVKPELKELLGSRDGGSALTHHHRSSRHHHPHMPRRRVAVQLHTRALIAPSHAHGGVLVFAGLSSRRMTACSPGCSL